MNFSLYSYKVDRLSGDILPVLVDDNNHIIDGIRLRPRAADESPQIILEEETMIRLFRRKPKEAPVKKKRFWDGMKRNKPRPERKPKVEQIEWVQPVIEGMAMDNSLQTSFSRKGMVAFGYA